MTEEKITNAIRTIILAAATDNKDAALVAAIPLLSSLFTSLERIATALEKSNVT